MRRFLLSTIILPTAFIALQAQSTWLPQPIRVNQTFSEAESNVFNPQICSSGNRVYTAWIRGGIQFNTSEDGGTTWLTEDLRIDHGGFFGNDENEFGGLGICCSGDEVYVVWTDLRDGGSDIYFNRSLDGGVTWLPVDTRLDTGDSLGSSGSTHPVITCGGGWVYAAWMDLRNSGGTTDYYDIYFNRSDNGGFSWLPEAVRLDTGDAPGAGASAHPRLCCLDEKVFVVWEDLRSGSQPQPYFMYPGDVFFNRSLDGGTTWFDTDKQLNAASSPADAGAGEDPRICCSTEGVFVIWHGSAGIYFRASPDDGATWPAPEHRLDQGGDFRTNRAIEAPHIRCSGENVYALWGEDPGEGRALYFNRSSDGGATWQPSDIRLDSGHGVDDIDLASSWGKIYALWSGGGRIWFNSSLDFGLSWQAVETDLGSFYGKTDMWGDYSRLQVDGAGYQAYAFWNAFLSNPENPEQRGINLLFNAFLPVSPPLIPPQNLSPPDGAAGLALSIGLSWAASPRAEAYDVYFGTVSPPPFAASVTATSFQPTLAYDTPYYWRIVARNTWGELAGEEWDFATTPYIERTLSLAVTGDGVTDPLPGIHNYPLGAGLNVNATPAGGWIFTQWTGDFPDGLEHSSTLPITMDINRSLTAGFADVDFLGAYKDQDQYGNPDSTFYFDDDWSYGRDLIVPFGQPGDVPVTGDWNGDGRMNYGVYRPDQARFFLDTDWDGIGDISRNFGRPGDIPVTGDWNGDGRADLGVYRPDTCRFYLDSDGDGMADMAIAFGRLGDIPVTGDWDGNGLTEWGIYRPGINRFYLDADRNGIADIARTFGQAGDRPVIGDWNGDGRSNYGIYRSTGSEFQLDTNWDGEPDLALGWDDGWGEIPVTFDWNR